MVYRIKGLDPAAFAWLEQASEAQRIAQNVHGVIAETDGGYPCRISLADAPMGTPMWLLPYTSQPISSPYTTRYAIYVTRGFGQAAEYHDRVPAMMQRRHVAIRGFDRAGMLQSARNVAPKEDLHAAIRTMLDEQDIPAVQVYCTAYGCFLGQAERD